MNPITNTILGLSFFLIAVASTLLMFHLWGYPFDHLTHTSAAPAGLVRLHRFLGYAYFAIYVTLMTQMVPRLWSYQIEFPARTVAHLMLGMAIGVILLIKIASELIEFLKCGSSQLSIGFLSFCCGLLWFGPWGFGRRGREFVGSGELGRGLLRGDCHPTFSGGCWL